MQKVTVASVKTKSGEGGKSGTWTLVIVTGEDGAEFTSFDKALTDLGKGAVIELEPEITTKNGKTKVNIKEWKLVSEGAPPATAEEQRTGPGGGGGGRGKDMDVINLEEAGRRYRQNIDRISIEAQSALVEIGNMIRAGLSGVPGVGPATDAVITPALLKQYQQVAGRIFTNYLAGPVGTVPAESKPTTTAPAGTGAPGQKPAQTGTGVQLPEFKTGVELVNYATKQGHKIEDIKRTLSINNPTEIKDVKAAAALLFAGKKPVHEGDPLADWK